MWWLLNLLVVVLVVGIVAVVSERRRATIGPDAREDRFRNPSRAPSWRDKDTVARAADVSVVLPPGTGWRRPPALWRRARRVEDGDATLARCGGRARRDAVSVLRGRQRDSGRGARVVKHQHAGRGFSGVARQPRNGSAHREQVPAAGRDRPLGEQGPRPRCDGAVVTPEGVWRGAAGVDGRDTPLVPESGMALASITKTFTAAEVMLLSERGQVELDAPPRRTSTFRRWPTGSRKRAPRAAQWSG